MNLATHHLKVSPMRLVRAWLFRERAVRGPSAFELDVLEQQVDREQQAVALAAGGAAGVSEQLTAVEANLRIALTDAATPGVIDARETRLLARLITRTKTAATTVTSQLKDLA